MTNGETKELLKLVENIETCLSQFETDNILLDKLKIIFQNMREHIKQNPSDVPIVKTQLWDFLNEYQEMISSGIQDLHEQEKDFVIPETKLIPHLIPTIQILYNHKKSGMKLEETHLKKYLKEIEALAKQLSKL